VIILIKMCVYVYILIVMELFVSLYEAN